MNQEEILEPGGACACVRRSGSGPRTSCQRPAPVSRQGFTREQKGARPPSRPYPCHASAQYCSGQVGAQVLELLNILPLDSALVSQRQY